MSEEKREFYYPKGKLFLSILILPLFIALGVFMIIIGVIEISIFAFFLGLFIIILFGSFMIANILKLIRGYPFIIITDEYIQLHPYTKSEATIYLTDIYQIRVSEQSFQKNIEIVLTDEKARFNQLSLHNKIRLCMNHFFSFSLYTLNTKVIKKEQRPEFLNLLNVIMEAIYGDSFLISDTLSKDNIESEFMEKYDPAPPVDRSINRTYFLKAYGYSFFIFALMFILFYLLISRDSNYLIYIIISLILYPFAKALIDLIFGFKIRHAIDKQKGVTYYFDQLLFVFDLVIFHLSIFVAPIGMIVLLIRYLIIRLKKS